jgi:superfamily II DNA or RNA helicase
MLYVQIVGRGLRPADGKDHCLILDHSDTTLRLGFPDAIHHEELDDGSPRKASARPGRTERLPMECSSCSCLKPAGVHVCPNCGFAPQRQANVHTIDGELTEFSTTKAKKLARVDRQAKQRWYSMLRWIAEQRAYKQGWAANQYRAKFEEWPGGLLELAIPPDPEVSNWVRHRMIRWAKSKARRIAA